MYQGLVTIGGKSWEVSIATTYQELAEGLSGISAIPAGTGMLFWLGADQIITVNSLQMLFPIDVAFISAETKIVSVHQNFEPGGTITSEVPIRYWLEVNTGELAGVSIDDEVDIIVYGSPIIESSFLQYLIPIMVLGIVGGFVGGIIKATRHQLGEFPQRRLEAGVGKVVTVPGGSRWKCEICKRELKPGEEALKIGSKVYCIECARSSKRQRYFTDTSTGIENSMFRFQTDLSAAFTEAIARVKRQTGG